MSHAFWDWSLEKYDGSDVKSACLDLQDTFGLNVNILLWCCWLAQENRDASALIEQAVHTIEPWSSNFTCAIREIRQQASEDPHAASLYKSLLACELDAEQIEQSMLFDLASAAQEAGCGIIDLARTALLTYADIKGVETDFTPLLKAVFPDRKTV
ncbi:MAG: hypothetical protein DHS20C06_16140 [Hyphobacterium sp.]|nr:MAG: hypothetical protein DHS20C06_16140 [Hyphobacterium sp.]